MSEPTCEHYDRHGHLRYRYVWPFWALGGAAVALLGNDHASVRLAGMTLGLAGFPVLLRLTRRRGDGRPKPAQPPKGESGVSPSRDGRR